MKKTVGIINAILILLILAGDVCYGLNRFLWLKGITSAGFVILGAVNLFFAFKAKTEEKKFCITMLIGLVFGMVGDIVLNVEFAVGAGVFALGHVVYFVAYCFLYKFKWIDLLYGAVIFVPVVLFMTLAPIFDYPNILMEIVCIVYALIIAMMTGKAISNLVRERNVLNIILVVGSILFCISDMMLLLDMYASIKSIVWDILCLGTYYPAQCVLACSLLFTKKKESKKTEA